MVAEELPIGEQAKLELLFQSISLEKLELLATKLADNFKLKFNKPKVKFILFFRSAYRSAVYTV